MLAPDVSESGLIRGRYERLGALGSGSQGDVLLCRDLQHDRKVAIKSRRVRSEADRERVLAEARVLLKMRPHPGIALVREDFFEGDLYYIVMDWIEGRSLASLLVSGGPPDVDDALRWLGQIADAIDHLHRHDPPIIHQDLKPANVVVTTEGNAVLVDFGVAGQYDVAGEGTPAYSAPEVGAGAEATRSSDLFSLAVTAHELLTGRLPDPEFGPALSMLAPTFHGEARRALASALSPNPKLRPASAAEFVDGLRSRPLALPPMLGGQPSTPFVDRMRDMAGIRKVWDEVLQERSRLVLVAGEAGIGKTRLVSELALTLHEEGATVLFGRTDPEPLAPFQPFVEALSHYAHQCPAGRLRAEAPRAAAELTLLLPILRERLPELEPVAAADPETRRYRLFDAVSSLVLSIARTGPLMIVLDDLHWADRSTLALLDHLLRRSQPVRLLIVGAFRESEVDASHPLADVLARYSSGRDVLRVSLDGLGEPEIAELMAGMSGHRAPATLVRQISSGTKGNPLFVNEMTRHLINADALTSAGRWREVDLEELGVPLGVGALIETRVARLGEESRRVLDTAAVAGREFELAVLERVVGGDPLPAIESAIRARLVEEESGRLGRFSFSHALFRQSLYEQLTPSRRLRMHAQIAAAIEDLSSWEPGSRLGDLAHHTFMAARGGDPDAVRAALPHSVRAGDAAVERAAFEEAVAHYWRTEELESLAGGSPEDRIDLLVKIAENATRVGLWEDARRAAHRAAELARSTGSPEELARAALSLFGGVFVDPFEVRGKDLRLLEEALSALPEEDSTTRARVMIWLAWLTFSHPNTAPDRWDRIEELSDEALAMARRLTDERTEAIVTVFHAATRFHPRFGPELAPKSEEIVRRARTTERIDLVGLALMIQTVSQTQSGNLDEAETPLGELEELGRFNPMLGFFGTACRLGIAILRGRLDDAERLVEVGQEQLERARSQTLLFIQLCLVFELRRLQGRLDEVLPTLDGLVTAFPNVPYVRCLLATALADADRLALAGEHFEVLAADLVQEATALIRGRNTMSYLAQVCHALGDVERGQILYELLSPYAEVHLADGRPIAGCRGYGAHYLGMLDGLLGRFDDAERHFELALRLHERMASPPWIAETKMRYAEMLLARDRLGDQSRAAKLVAETMLAAGQIGAAGLVRRARSLVLFS